MTILSTDYAGTISIKWREIEQIQSRYLYEVRLDEGDRLYGRFVAGDTADQLTLFSHENASSLGQKAYLGSKVISHGHPSFVVSALARATALHRMV